MEILTLAQREVINGVILRCQDAAGQPWYCFHCLADLPDDWFAQSAHRCGEPTRQLASGPLPLPDDPAHKTRTTPPNGYLYDADGSRRTDKRGRLMRDPFSYAICSCGWVSGGATRQEARQRARGHRDERAAMLALLQKLGG